VHDVCLRDLVLENLHFSWFSEVFRVFWGVFWVLGGAPRFFGVFGMFRDVLGCPGVPVFRCSGVPGSTTCPFHDFRLQFFECVRVSLYIIAFDEVERKPNFDLWLFRVGLPVHGSRPKKTTFL